MVGALLPLEDLLGASAGFVRAGQTVPMGQAGFFGLLPGEVVCTENLAFP